MTTNHFSPECPECSSRLKRLPATRRGQAHVFCMDCGHDFGRFEYLVERYRLELETLEAKLGLPPTGAEETPASTAQQHS
ncbi:hypothetical protein J7J47_12735 [Halomonas sp. ISL-60]|uniref:hypothetical protein n=1 Tax=unclassified Halomonas TaxID=2609666 RepID=UPI0007D92637|nr:MULTISPECIES: hypothetical protein [unclassified Halomonas]MBT2773088.1 hypothetical protein [Halomonas sp. ISL-60]MBT2784909.1 hypothetical protein [Halomonas sp. ISL-106]MBT2796603.1 hypothetical protein [Halomonas sp. ISL-104]MBT2801706.1 hypothetical protein [Halomonas sp. ISL-56]OAL59839.1 hypothetical protein A6R74_00765 [Halomonas sp. ALS9]